jgi:integrase
MSLLSQESFIVDTSQAEDHQDEKPPDLRPTVHWSMRQFLEFFFLPNYLQLRRRRPGTIKLYFQFIKLWELLTSNPALCLIDQETVRDFVQRLQDRPGQGKPYLSPNTVRKLCTHGQKMLDYAGPKSRRNRSAAQLIVDVPYLERPDRVQNPVRVIPTLEEIGIYLSSCRFAKPTSNLHSLNAGLFHKSITIFIYNTALRIDCVMQLEWEMVDQNKKDWITIPASILKGHKIYEMCYLNRFAREAIEILHRPGEKRLFPFAGWPKSQGWFQSCRRKILAKTPIPKERHFGPHGLRRATITTLTRENPMVASIVAMHRSVNVTRDSYTDPEIVIPYLDLLPQPRVIESERQLTLF